MAKNRLSIVLFLTLLIGLVICACQSDKNAFSYFTSKDAITAYNLIEADEAFDLLQEDSSKFVPIQISKNEVYKKEHLPNALNIWRPDYGSTLRSPYGGLIPSKDKLQSLLRQLGYTDDKVLLLYDVKANVDAMRFAWVLNLYGFDSFKIINGGFKFWKEQDYPVTDLIVVADSTDYDLAESFDATIIANFEEVRAAVSDKNTILIDTRESYEYRGEPFVSKGTIYDYKKGAFDRGSIPSAIHLNWSELADLSGDHRIKAEHDLRYNLEKKGITPDKDIILYCQSGSRTSHMFYVLKHVLGFPKVKNYDGSWIEWSYKNSIDTTVPILKLCSEVRFEEMRDSLTNELLD